MKELNVAFYLPVDDLARLARAILRVRQERSLDLPEELFGGERAWDILLLLFVADAQGKRLTGRTALHESLCPPAIGRRWLRYLAQQQLIVGDGDGNLDDTLTLTPRALAALERWLASARVALAE